MHNSTTAQIITYQLTLLLPLIFQFTFSHNTRQTRNHATTQIITSLFSGSIYRQYFHTMIDNLAPYTDNTFTQRSRFRH